MWNVVIHCISRDFSFTRTLMINLFLLFLLGADCPSFTVDYGGQRCFKMDRNTQGRGDTLARRDGTNYFEKICLRGQISGCRDKAWAFERMPGFHLEGHDNKIFQNVPSRRDCEEKCLRERSFTCRSAEYNAVSLDCVLSQESRRTRPRDFRESRNIDYLENGCITTSKSLTTLLLFSISQCSKIRKKSANKNLEKLFRF